VRIEPAAGGNDTDAQACSLDDHAPEETIVPTPVSSAPDTMPMVAHTVAAAAKTILGAGASAIVALDPIDDVVETTAATEPQNPLRLGAAELRELVIRALSAGEATPRGSTLAIPLTGRDVLLLDGIPDAGAASAPDVVNAVGALATAAFAEMRRATTLAAEVDTVRTWRDRTIETERLEAVGELAAGVAHHLNNIMTVILATVDLAARRPNAINPDCLQRIRQASLEATEIVRRLGSFSRRRGDEPRSIVDLNALVEEAVALSRGRWQDEAQLHGIDIDLHVNAELTPPVGIDKASLQEVVVSLLLNAIDALPNGGRIRVRTWSTEEMVHCEIADDGVGMSREVRQRALEPFFTTKGPRRRGLGLSQSYGIVQQHGGTLTLESSEGRGTTVTFTLPTSRALWVQETERASLAGNEPMTILLVDDDSAVRVTVASLLSDDGHTVVEAGSGAEALSRLETKDRFDLLMTDLGMPKMNGWELIRSAKLQRPNLPVVLVTGWGETPRGQRPTDPQPDAILAKPVTESDLRGTIRRFQRLGSSA
jgi:signal transduction histidine kinase